LRVLIVVPPERTNLVLPSDVPYSEADALVLDRLHIESDGGDGGNHLAKLELVEDGRLTGGIKTDLGRERAREEGKGLVGDDAYSIRTTCVTIKILASFFRKRRSHSRENWIPIFSFKGSGDKGGTQIRSGSAKYKPTTSTYLNPVQKRKCWAISGPTKAMKDKFGAGDPVRGRGRSRLEERRDTFGLLPAEQRLLTEKFCANRRPDQRQL
jgi:hypothetical protein